MKITKRQGPPEDLVYFDDELDLKEKDVEDVVEIFNTPLTGSYNWDYTVAENRIRTWERTKLEWLNRSRLELYPSIRRTSCRNRWS